MPDARYHQLVATLPLRGQATPALRDALRTAVAGFIQDGWIFRRYDTLAEATGAITIACVPVSETAAGRVAAALRGVVRAHAPGVKGCTVARARALWLEDPRRCTCSRASGYVLAVDHFGDPTPVVCTRCRGDVALADRLPAPLARRVLAWNMRGSHLHDLWLFDAGVYERWAGRELEYVESAVNVEGRELAAAVAKATGVPTWYRIFSHDEADGRATGRCPGCRKPWARKADRRGATEWCERCRLARYGPVVDKKPKRERRRRRAAPARRR